MSKLFIMIGAPGSGKTTWCKNNVPKNAVYISRDEIRFNIIKDEDSYFSKEKIVYDIFINKINEALESGLDVYADQTSLNAGSRKKLIDALNKRPDEINVIYIERPLSTILEYNLKRTGRKLVPNDVIIKMYNSISKPTAKEGIDYLYIINKNGNIQKINLKEDW